jgi:hypothetical protein
MRTASMDGADAESTVTARDVLKLSVVELEIVV